jgi:hypothetical protein
VWSSPSAGTEEVNEDRRGTDKTGEIASPRFRGGGLVKMRAGAASALTVRTSVRRPCHRVRDRASVEDFPVQPSEKLSMYSDGQPLGVTYSGRHHRRRGTNVGNLRPLAVLVAALLLAVGLASSAGAANASVAAGLYIRTNGPAHELLVVTEDGHKYDCAASHVPEKVTKTAHAVDYAFDCGHIGVLYEDTPGKIHLRVKVGSWTHFCVTNYRIGNVYHAPYHYKYGVWHCQ